MNLDERRHEAHSASPGARSDAIPSLPSRVALERALADDAPLISLQLAAPRAAVEALLSERGGAPTVLFAPPEGAHVAGLGAAASLRAEGAGRFEAIARASASHPTSARSLSGDGAPTPRWFGGFAFEVTRAPSARWREFGDAHFVLPRVAYAVSEREAWLTLTLRPEERAPTQVERELKALFARLSRSAAQGHNTSAKLTNAAAAPAAATTDAERERWGALVNAILAAIERGEVEKVVAARAERYPVAQPVDGPQVLRRLGGEPHLNRVAVRFGEAEFIAATPERLVSLQGLQVRTEALAGTLRAGRPEAALALLASAKDRAEHRHVTDEIVRCLTPLATVRAAAEPSVRELRHVVHLLTPIFAELKRPAHVLSLVQALHPTPAVGGTPTAAALRFLREHEPLERGWYGSPIGWFDAAGDGEFWVGLRSALLEPRQVHLFAGAGIVRGSEHQREYTETELKLRALGQALGLTSERLPDERERAGSGSDLGAPQRGPASAHEE